MVIPVKSISPLQLLTQTDAHSGDTAWTVAWHPSHPLLATGGSDKCVKLWRISEETGAVKFVHELSDIHSRTVRSLAFNCDGLLACASFDSTVSIWKPRGTSGDCAYEMMCTLEGHENEVKSVAWSPSGNLLATCGRDKSVWIWMLDVDADEFECIAVLQEHTQDVKMVKWHPSKDLLVSCSYDDTIKIWMEDDEDWYCGQTLTGYHSSTVWAVDFSADGRHLISVGDDLSICVFESANVDGSEWKLLFKKTDNVDHSRTIYTCSFNSYNNLIATGGGDDSICIFKFSQQLERIGQMENAHSGDVNCVCWSPSHANLLASVGDDGQLKLWKCSQE